MPSEHHDDAAGRLRGPENLYENVTMGTVRRVGKLPATKGELQDTNAIVQAHNTAFEQYKNETTTIFNALVTRLNSLTLVGSLLRHAWFKEACIFHALHLSAGPARHQVYVDAGHACTLDIMFSPQG